ncbi:Ig-like domain-containing protein [Flavobacterium soli]|uniref:Ig-like domain-containing protein n=1 Tax=Flavobacterium soli TaxID=344881 RepID=UPI00041C0DBC|nr:T9SS type A sorting domain-containing protein [Flavobacterium soli]
MRKITLSCKLRWYNPLRFQKNVWGILMLMMLFIQSGFSQTVLIDPAGEGGFELGASFTANGWTSVNAATDGWAVGSVPVVATGSNCAYVSANGGAAWSYSQLSTFTHIYRDVTIPAGETKLSLSFKWKAGGEGSTTSDWDNLKLWLAPVTVTPTTGSQVSGATQLIGPGANNGMYKLSSATWNSETIQFVGVPGTTYRLIFSWKSDVSDIANPPSALDDISFVSSMPGDYITIASGNWNDPLIWDSGVVPGSLDNATISTGHIVSINATGLSAKDVTVNGTLEYGTTPTSFSALGNLTVNAGGLLNVFNGTTGKTINVAGNFVNNGTVDLSVGTTSAGNLTLNGSMLQTVSGSGTFVNGKIRNLTCSNTSTAIPNIDWQVNNLSVEYNLSISNAKINLGTNKFTHGTSTTAHTGLGSFTFTNGGFIGGKFSRWWSAGATGYTTASPTSIPTGAAGRYPFYTLDGQQRILYIGRATPTVGGEYAVVYNNSSTVTSGLSIVDGAYTITDRWNGSFQVSTEGTSPVAASYWATIFAPNVYYPLNGFGRVLGQAAALSGTHVNSTAGASAQRNTMTEADLLTATGLYMGINSADLLFASVASGDWNNPATWNKGIVPSCTDAVTIASGTTVTVNSAANVAKDVNIAVGGTLSVASGDLTVGCTLKNNLFVNNGTLTVSGGVLNINGSFTHNSGSTFNQSAGAINVDGNDAGAAATSVASSISIVQLNSNLINWTGGTLTVVDPHANPTASNSFTYTSGTSINVTAGHTLRFGDGVSTDAGGNATNGFRMNTWASSGRISFFNLEINGAAGANRFVSSTYTYGVNGDFVINANGEYREGTNTTYVAGNVSNSGTYFNTGTLYLGSLLNGVVAPSLNVQTISGAGIYANALTGSTANLSTLSVNNTNASGVTLNVPLSLSGNLNLVAGKLNTTDANLLTVGTATAAANISGGSATAYVNGPLSRTIVSGNANTNYIVFPIGKTDYTPIALAPSTTAVSSFKAEAFANNTGTADATINTLADKRWQVVNLSGTYTDINVRVGEAGIVATSIPVQGTSAAGVYSNAFGSLATFTSGTPNTTESNSAVVAANFTGFISYANSNVCSGTPTPGNLIASSSVICLGTTVNFSLQNDTPGTGVSYVWESSINGVDFTPIDEATTSTYSTVPSVEMYYRVQVTCGANTGTTSVVHLTFNNSITGTTPAARCGVGTVDLEAVGSLGSTIKWYADATGGLSLGSGSPFTTPAISENTTYYAAAETSSAGMISLGAGATTSSSVGQSLLPGGWGGAKTQYIIRATELVAAGLTAGNITSLGFEPTISGQTYQGFYVSIGNTANTTAPTTTFLSAGLTQVFAGTEANDGFTPVSNSVNTLAFGTGTGSATSFNWDGTSNIVVSISWSRVPAAATATGTAMKVDNVGFVSTAYRQRDNLAPAAMLAETSVSSTTNFRPKFIIDGLVICSSPRVAVAATVSAPPAFTLSATSAVICIGETVDQPVTITAGATDYDTFLWTPSTGVTGDATSGWVFNPATTTDYVLSATQSAGVCATTAEFTVTVNPLPNTIIFSPAAPALCTDGSPVMLTALPQVATPVGACLTSPNGQWPSGTYTPTTCDGVTANNIVTNAYAGEYSSVNVLANTKYTFTSTGGSDYVTISNAAGTTVLAAGPSPIQWVSTSAATIRFYSHTDAACGAASVNRTRSIICSPLTPVVWSPIAGLFTDAEGMVAYTGTPAVSVYAKPVSTTDYTATATTSADCSTSSDVTVTVNALPSLVITNPAAVCSPSTVDITAAAVTAGSDADLTLSYWADPNATVTFPNPNAISSSGTFYIKAVNANGCSEVVSVAVTVNTLPSLVVTSPAAVCFPSTVDITAAAVTAGSDADLTLSYWADPNATVTFPDPNAIASSGTFYIRAENANGCFVISPVSVVVNVVDAPTGDAAQSFNNVATVADLDATGDGIQWYDAATEGTLLTSETPLVNGGMYFASQTVGGCESTMRLEVTVTIVSTIIDYVNLQFPGTATINEGGSFDIYAQVYDAGVTEAAGANAAITAWIGYSSTNENPNSASFTWIPANYNVQSGNNDEYSISLGSTLPVGTYYYASRFQVNGGDFAYGGYSATNGGFWDGTTNINGVLTVQEPEITYANIQFPGTATITVGGSETIYAQVYAQGVTEAVGAATGITAWIGYSSTDENPNAASFTWVPATFNVQSGNNDEFSLALGTGLTAGTYYYASRFQLNGGDFVYGGYSATNGGFWNGTTNVNGVLTVNCGVVAAPTTANPTQDFNTGDDLSTFDVTGENLIWYDAATDGNVLPSTTVITTGTVYYVSQTVGGCESADRLMITAGVDLRTPGFDTANLKYYPNPVSDILTVTYSGTIESIEVFNVLGQRVYQKTHNAQEVKIDMSNLASGNYIVNVVSNGLVKNLKVIKK